MRARQYSSGAGKPRAVIFHLSDCIFAISSLVTVEKENDLCRSITGSSEASRNCCMFKRHHWQTLSYHLIKGLQCLANLSFEGWLSLSDKYFLVAVQGKDFDIQIHQAHSGTDVTIGKDAWQQQPVRLSSRGQETSAYRPPMLTRLTTSACLYISGPALAFPWLAITIKKHLLAVALFALHSPWPVFHLYTVNEGATVWGGCELCVFSTQGWHTREHMSPPTAG